MRVRAYLSLVITAILIPMITFSALALKMLLDDEREAVQTSMLESARATALTVDRELARAEAVLKALAASADLEKGNLAEFHRQARAINRGSDTWTVLIDENARQLVNTALPFGAPLPPPGGGHHVQETLDAGRVVVSNLRFGAAVDEHVIAVSLPLSTGDGRRFVISQAFRASYFRSAFKRPNLRANWIVAIIDRAGVTIARSHAHENYVGKPTIADLAKASQSEAEGVLRTRALDGTPIHAAYTRSEPAGWTIAIGVPLAEVESAAQRTVAIAALGLLAAFACAVGVAALFGRKLLRAIDGAAGSAAALGRGEALNISLSGVSEIDRLNHALSKAGMLLATAEAERARLFASEQAAREHAERESRAKDQFLALLGHELRNPLAAIIGAVEIVDALGVRAPDSARAQRIIGRQAGHLSRIVDDILEVSRMTTGRISLARTGGDLADAVAAAIEALQVAGRTNGYRFDTDLHPVALHADWTRIDQVINNLLVNAIKYSPEGSAIAVRTGVEGERGVLVVRDNGIGIASDLLPHIFDPFVQGDVSLDRAQGGLGIGLTLVRELARLHGGTVDAHSEGTGRGSTFTVRLPLTRD